MQKLILLVFSLVVVISGFGQDRLLKGSVLDASSGQLLIGATIQEGQNRGTTTDTNGQFELRIRQLPITLSVSYIGYETRALELASFPEEPLTIRLIPKTTQLNEVVVSAEAIVTPITDAKEYSVIDFIIIGEKILTLEYHGSFENYRMTVFDLNGNPQYVTILNDVKLIEGLHKSCNKNPFLVTEYMAFELKLHTDSLTVVAAHEKDIFENYVRSCKVVEGDMAYYIFDQANTMVRIVKAFNIKTQQDKRLQTVADPNQIRQAFGDLNKIVKGATVNSIMYQKPVDNQTARRMQAESDFLRVIYYKAEFPVHMFAQGGRVLLLNHPQKQMNVYKNGEQVDQKPLAYVEEHQWTKRMVYDEIREEIYAIFDTAKGYNLQRVDTETGTCKTAYWIDSDVHLEKLVIRDGVLFYLQKGNGASAKRGVYRQE
jgi:hypothetical protein